MGRQVNLGKTSNKTVRFQPNSSLDSAITPIFKTFIKNFSALYRCTVGDGFTLKLAGPDAAHGFPQLKDKAVSIVLLKAVDGQPFFVVECAGV